ncbi:MAG TPA: HAMP domain-containing sensor histidine kinase [Bacillota bacterium]|nr:HAMP domain-containing sensor histidine kinase [Bacillota bacterium]HOR84993.1 HAMP domain-containing sensor histidine kinase [Bacillota bacterium]HPL52893.1 HAMP domain-containing sensor histidine kinase [Bacillota bacterium]
MRNSIQKKLFITYGIAIIIGFAILALTLLKIFDRYFIENRKELLYEQGRKVAREAASVLYLGNPDSKSLINDLQVLDKFLNAHIWVVNGEGTVIAVSGSREDSLLGRRVSEEKLCILAKGESIEARGNFEGMLSEPSLTVGYPVFVNGRFSGGVLVHASLLEIQGNLREIYRLTLWAILVSVAVAYGILYIQIRRISDPLREISEAARVIAGGEFQRRLDIKTGDEIEELGRSFNNMAESLEKIEENRRNLIANISHDLRSPMTSIRGFIEGIVDGTIPEDRREHYLSIVLEESKRLIEITNELLELSNIQQGRLEIREEAFELNETIRKKFIAYEKRITEKKLNVTFSICEERIMAMSDKGLIERVLSNLLDNAVKFTPEMGSIEIRTLSKEGSITVEIKNTGESINSKELTKVWERFYKGDASRGLYKGGYGLGLSIVKEIISQLNEKIWVSGGEGYVVFAFTVKKA